MRHVRWSKSSLALAASIAALCLIAVVAPKARAQRASASPLIGGSDSIPPAVYITPMTGTVDSQTVHVSIVWCDNNSIRTGTQNITLNSADVTSNFTAPVSGGTPRCTATYTSTGAISLVHAGHTADTLRAVIFDNALNEGQSTVIYTYHPPATPPRPVVTPVAQAVTIPVNHATTTGVLIRNVDTATATYALHVHCSGAAFANPSACTTSADSIVVGAGATVGASVSYTTSATAGTQGTFTVSALLKRDTTIRDSASVDILLATAPAPGIVVLGVTALASQQERGQCLTVYLTPSASYQCGDVQITHELPAVRTLNKLRTPALIYTTQVAHPHPLLAANVTLDPAWGTPDSVEAQLTIGGVTYGKGQWIGGPFGGGATQRIVVGFDAQAMDPDSSFTNTDVLTVTAKWLASGTTHTLTSNWAVAVINRAQSRLGRGWAVAGVERLRFTHLSGSNDLWWEGADGSTRYYVPVPAHPTTWWYSPSLDRGDTIKYNGTQQFYLRYLTHGAKVMFNAAGQHIKTIDRLADTTSFFYSSATDTAALDSIVLPAPTGAHLAYRFYYDATTHVLDSITAPGSAGGGARRSIQLQLNARRELTRLLDPDGDSVTYAYNSVDTGAIQSITERSGTTTTFTLDGGQKLGSISTAMGTGHTPIAVAFAPAETKGLLSPVAPDSAYTLVNGPRTDTTVTRFWLDGFGEPVRVKDALGYETTYQRTDARWPIQVTRVRYANGRVVSASYDARGNVASTIDSTHYRDTLSTRLYATTTYQWDGKYDFITKIALPEQDSTTFGVDTSTGNRLWQQNGLGTASRVTFQYYSSGNGKGLLRSVTQPGGATDSVTYDALGNVDSTRTPLGYWTSYLHDAIGRTVRTISPIDTLQVAHKVDSVQYDVMDRAIHQVTIGPPLHTGTGDATPQLTLSVANYYNAGGGLDSLQRNSSPDTNAIHVVTTKWTYDPLMRVVDEFDPGPVSNHQHFTYDAAGNILTQVTRRNSTITMAYDALNRLVQRTIPSVHYADTTTGTWQFPRYSNDGGTGYTIPQNVETFGYDAAGNVVMADNAYARIARSYNPDGTLRADTSRIRTYASTGGELDWNMHVYGLTFAYDLDGRRTTLHHPAVLAPHLSGVLKDSTRYRYESTTGFLSSITDPLGNAFTFQYDNQGRLQRLNYPGGIYEVRAYDNDSRVTRRTEIATALVGTDIGFARDTIRDEHRSLSPEGQITSAKSLYPWADTSQNTYDGLGALTHSTRAYEVWGVDSVWCPTGCYFTAFSNEQMALDALGNVRTRSDKSYTDPNDPTSWAGDNKTMTYETGSGRLLSAGAPQDLYRYDLAGNNYFYQHQTNTSVGTMERGARYYAADDRLAASDVETSFSCYQNSCYKTFFEEYWYDALGRRVLRRSRAAVSCPSQNNCRSVIQRTVWDGNEILYETQYPGWDNVSADALELDTVTTIPDGRFAGRVAYTNGPQLDQPLDVIRMGYGYDYSDGYGFDGYEALAVVPHWDWRGTADLGSFDDGAQKRCRINSSGGHNMSRCVTIDWVYAVNALRDPLLRLNDQSWFGSLTRQQQDASGLLYMRNRYYDPLTGRFTQEDPLGLAGGLNAYGYASGDPIDYADPFGTCPFLQAICSFFTSLLHSSPQSAEEQRQSAAITKAVEARIIADEEEGEDAEEIALDAEQTAGALEIAQLHAEKAATAAKVTSTLATVRSTGQAPKGYRGGGTFDNDGRGGGQILPTKTANGDPITYREWDVNPYAKGVNRGPERLVTGSDGSAYYTADHYLTFQRVP